jgi:hypothetical protein
VPKRLIEADLRFSSPDAGDFRIHLTLSSNNSQDKKFLIESVGFLFFCPSNSISLALKATSALSGFRLAHGQFSSFRVFSNNFLASVVLDGQNKSLD